jgi:hypothetical protein
MTTIQTSRYNKLFVGVLAVSSVAVCAPNANAASLAIGSTVQSTDVFSGSAFTVNSDYLGTALLSLTASGTVNLDNTSALGYTTNAAGVVTTPTSSLGNAGTASAAPSTASYGSLLLGNADLGFFQVFAPNSTNGFGSSSPSTNLSFSDISLSSIFGSGLTNGTVLEFRVTDSNTGDNSGSFAVSGSIVDAQAVPEPFTIVGTLIGGTAALRMKKKLKADKK